LKCGAGEEWKRSVGSIVLEMNYYTESRRRGIKRRKANWIGHILRRHCLLKHVIERKREGYK
jgi:hypothetical protein